MGPDAAEDMGGIRVGCQGRALRGLWPWRARYRAGAVVGVASGAGSRATGRSRPGHEGRHPDRQAADDGVRQPALARPGAVRRSTRLDRRAPSPRRSAVGWGIRQLRDGSGDRPWASITGRPTPGRRLTAGRSASPTSPSRARPRVAQARRSPTPGTCFAHRRLVRQGRRRWRDSAQQQDQPRIAEVALFGPEHGGDQAPSSTLWVSASTSPRGRCAGSSVRLRGRQASASGPRGYPQVRIADVAASRSSSASCASHEGRADGWSQASRAPSPEAIRPIDRRREPRCHHARSGAMADATDRPCSRPTRISARPRDARVGPICSRPGDASRGRWRDARCATVPRGAAQPPRWSARAGRVPGLTGGGKGPGVERPPSWGHRRRPCR